MKQRVTLRSTPSLVSEYRALLTSDWSGGLDHAGRIITLLRRELSTGRRGLLFHWEAPPRPVRGSSARPPIAPIPANASDALREFLERANATATEPLEKVELPQLPDAIDRTVTQAWFLLAIQWELDLVGDVGLFRDTQSLLFLSAIHDVLPAARAAGRHEEHALLVATMRWHAANVWQDEPAHSMHLAGRLHEYLGHAEPTKEAFLRAFLLTPRSDHDYLTRAQAYWSHLVDADQFAEARHFALRLYREAPEDALPEVARLVQRSYATFDAQVRDGE